MAQPLGRREPTDWVHLERYTAAAPIAENLPVVLGTLWLAAFDKPVKGRDGIWRIPNSVNWKASRVRGGHAYCLEPHGGQDHWWPKHDQPRGSCTGHSAARAAELMFRKAMDSEAWYDRNQQIDEFTDTPPEEGSSVRAAFDVWRTEGAYRKSHGDLNYRIARNEWLTSAEDVRSTLGHRSGEVPILQSWGMTWPHRVRIPLEVIDWLLERDGEAAVPIG